MSDFFGFVLVTLSFVLSHGALYKYARLKFVVTSIILAINVALFAFGIYLLIKLPSASNS